MRTNDFEETVVSCTCLSIVLRPCRMCSLPPFPLSTARHDLARLALPLRVPAHGCWLQKLKIEPKWRNDAIIWAALCSAILLKKADHWPEGCPSLDQAAL